MLCSDIFETALYEGRDAHLYHATSFRGAKHIILDNKIGEYTEQEIAGRMIKGVSLTRDIRFAHRWDNVVLQIDQARLAQDKKIMPIDYHGMSLLKTRRQGNSAEAEEFVIGPISPLDRYLTAVMVRAAALDQTELAAGNIVMKLNAYADNQTFAAIAKHPLLKIVTDWKS